MNAFWISRRVYPHLLRRSLATNLLNRGAGLMSLRNRSEYDFFKPAYM